MPHRRFLAAAEVEAYDVDRLATRFDVGFDTICHRVSSLQRLGAVGVPFFFARVDRAGNVSKRQSETDFHFSRVGGSCPLWNVYEVFARPGEVVRRFARIPDERTYLRVALTARYAPEYWRAPIKTFAIGLGCDIAHVGLLIYSHGLDLDDDDADRSWLQGLRTHRLSVARLPDERAPHRRRRDPGDGRALWVSVRLNPRSAKGLLGERLHDHHAASSATGGGNRR